MGKMVEFKKILPRDYPRQHHYMRVSEMSGYSVGDDLSGCYYIAADYEALEAQLAAADKGLLKASDPNSGWQGINKECKLWQEKAEALEAKLAALVDELKHMAKQKLESEMPEDEREDADYRTGYDCLVRIARVLVATAAAKVNP